MATTLSSIVFDGMFSVNAIDKEGKKFDRVSRLYAHSQNEDIDLTLDYNVELFSLQIGEDFSLALATSLSGSRTGPTAGEEGAEAERDEWRPDRKGKTGSLDDDYEYVMYGKIYKFDAQSGEIVTAYASFGGLLMSLSGSFRHMTNIVLGDQVYLLTRK